MSELVFIEQKPMEGKQHPPQGGTTIGREGCDINIADPEISRNHATIRRTDDGGVAIEDLGSTNGTFVNGERIEGLRQLTEGDEVRFGSTVWKLQAPAGATAAAGTAPPQVTAFSEAQPDAPQEQPAAAPPAPAEPPAAAPAADRPPAPPPPMPDPVAVATGPDKRGDVPRPDFAPSAIRRVIPPPGDQVAFNPAGSRRKGSAATRLEATVFATAVTALTAIGVVLYYILEPFKP